MLAENYHIILTINKEAPLSNTPPPPNKHTHTSKGPDRNKLPGGGGGGLNRENTVKEEYSGFRKTQVNENYVYKKV